MAKLSSDFSLIEDQSAKDHKAYPAFVTAMKGRAYGSEAINDAWVWFKEGYEAGFDTAASSEE